MKTIERYILRRTLGSFLVTLIAMTGVVWSTQALRQLDLVTSKGQTLLQFFYITMLGLPFLVVIVAPFAMIIAMIIVLNGMARDSELIVINASGASRSLVLRPIMLFSLLIALLLGFFSTYLAPTSRALMRDEITKVRVDLVANIVKPGRFIEIEDGLTFHIRNRSGDGILEGLLLSDEREQETGFTYTAERGRIIEAADKTILVMLDGTIQRRPQGSSDISIVSFESYGFDLSSMIPEAREPTYKASDRPTLELLNADPDDTYAQRHWNRLIVEFHDRVSQPLYPLAFGLILYAFLGSAKTTRQNQSMSLLGAFVSCFAVRTLGFGGTMIVNSQVSLFPILYAIPVIAGLLAVWSIVFGRTPAWLSELSFKLETLMERMRTKRLGRRKAESGESA
ncbi:LPS export ABC transporter permease LptF [Pseudovibrio exalbescens]|uniref:LPS export ABC transporter permease LptF n=1 Tax=Pseudovibrio exalbescens TaxID=197461 RepID=UPI002366D5AF|nr:LPS export ABC transporter permease LptF [Pseudovibrio exalbescens]MDD7908902.1 LPS export ABC transporter permease LptF [Pseudovibrio exalbescens]